MPTYVLKYPLRYPKLVNGLEHSRPVKNGHLKTNTKCRNIFFSMAAQAENRTHDFYFVFKIVFIITLLPAHVSSAVSTLIFSKKG
jgi:hypothetical protein